MAQAAVLVLFDIDGTLVRRAGPHHEQVLVDAVRRVTQVETTTEGVPVAGMLDRDILKIMMQRAGMRAGAIRDAMPFVVEQAVEMFAQTCPSLERNVCPGVRRALFTLERRGASLGLVTGNLRQIGLTKLECAGLASFFRFGAFAEEARDRAGLVQVAMREARKAGFAGRNTRVSLVGDHPNDVKAAHANGIRAIAVNTGSTTLEELAAHAPDLLLPDLRALTWEMVR